MKIDIEETKPINGVKWKIVTLTNNQGMSVTFLNFGGIITKILVPDKNGKLENVVLAYKNEEQYLTNPGYLGAIIGRVAGRIQGASFKIDDKTFKVDDNEGIHCLHGGTSGLNNALWEIEPYQSFNELCVKLSHRSKDGEGGFPGNLDIEVIYKLNNRNQLTIDYIASTDKKTPITLTNHSYFNLSGNAKRTIHDHEIAVDSKEFIELDEELIPTGKLLDVSGTTFDFRNSRLLQKGFNNDFYQNRLAGSGYDHYFVFEHKQEEQIWLKDKESGRTLSVKTNQPGFVMYTSNNLEEGLELTEGITEKYLGVCLETQGTPVSLHHHNFPSIVQNENDVYKKQTIFTFGIG